MSTVTLRNVHKSFGETKVINGVNVEIDDGELVILVGPSGCGKSTLLRMIAGLEEVTSGDVAIDGQIINHVPPRDRDIAMVFQNYALYPHFTVEKNMGFSLKLAGVPKEQIREKVAAVAGPLGLTDYLQRYPKELSGGQRQRVATGRAIVRNPNVFLFDEPLSNLDAKLRVQMRSEIRELQRRLGVTSIYVTHDQVEAMTMADKIVILRHGIVEQIGAPLELYDTPANTFVATFIGSPAMNLLDGSVEGNAVRLFADFLYQLPVNTISESRLTVGFRPDHISVHDNAISDAFTAEVINYEVTGSETTLFLVKDSRPLTIVTKERLDLATGKTVWLRPDLLNAHVFGPGGNRLVFS